MYSQKDISYLRSVKYEFDDECTFDDLIRFHKQYVDNDYSFWNWFNDEIEFGIINILH